MKNVMLTMLACLTVGPAIAQERELRSVSPQFESQFTHEQLKNPASVAVSPDGKFLYTAGYMEEPTCLVLQHDRETQTLEFVDSITDEERLSGTTSIRLSHDGRYAVTASFGSGAVTLFRRDQDTGQLGMLDSQSENDAKVSGLAFIIEAGFSYNDRFVNVLDDSGGVTAFRVVEDGDDVRFEFVQALRSNHLLGARGLAHHPNADFLFVACKVSHTLVVLNQDPETGQMEILETVHDDYRGVTGLHSAFGVSVCPRGKYVYTVSGLHGGGQDNAVCVFRFDLFAENKLQIVQEMFLKNTELDGSFFRFLGGNEVCADRFRLFACGTASGSIAGFARDPIAGTISLKTMIEDRSQYQGIAGLAISPDGKYLYAACDQANSICAIALSE